MALNIKNEQGFLIYPDITLLTRSGNKIGAVKYSNFHVKEIMNDANEISFAVYKDTCLDKIWDKLLTFKLLYVQEWKQLFEIDVEEKQDFSLLKKITGKSLGYCELSKIKNFELEINTEDDINREDYRVAKLYDAEHFDDCIIGRILSKAPHYKVVHVDETIADIQRTFSFDNEDVIKCFEDVSEEIGCYFDIKCFINDDNVIERQISVYDLQQNCLYCGERGDFIDVCPNCGGKHILNGYGEDTKIFINKDNLGKEINLSVKSDNLCNCFKLKTGDDLMTAAVVACNPNGSSYIWNINKSMSEDMSDELREKLSQYNSLYDYYEKSHITSLQKEIVDEYNKIVAKYNLFDVKQIPFLEYDIIGFQKLMESNFNSIDLDLFLSDEFMPSFIMEKTNAKKEVEKIHSYDFKIGLKNLDSSTTIVNNSLLSLLKSIINPNFKVKIIESNYLDNIWSGKFNVTNYSDEADTFDSDTVYFEADDNYEEYVKQKIDKIISGKRNESVDIVSLFKLEEEEFKAELKKYCLNCLSGFFDVCQSCIDIMIEQGVASPSQLGNVIYEKLYVPYLNKIEHIDNEIKIRENEIDLVKLVKEEISNCIKEIQNTLQFEKFLGNKLVSEFASYRRDDLYSNDNYVSDGLDNTELFRNANEFLKTAKKEIAKASSEQHTLTSNLKNLLLIKEFEPIVDFFEIGNWIRFEINNNIFKLRLIEYELDYDSPNELRVSFSDVIHIDNVADDIESILKSASNMSVSYDSVSRQARNSVKTKNKLQDVVYDGIDVDNVSISTKANNQTQKWDNHGMTFREYDQDTGEYSQEQMRIINSTLSITDDNWKTVKTAVGKFFYVDDDGKVKTAFGVNADVLIGNLILGKQLKISAENADLTFDGDGLNVGNGDNVITINPNDKELFVIRNGVKKLLYFDTSGRLRIDGEGVYLDENATIEQIESAIMTNASNISGEIDRASAMEDLLDLSKVSKENVVSIDVIRGQSSLDDKLPNAYAIRDIVSKLDSIKYGNFSVTTDENGMFHIPLEHRYEKMYTFVSGNSNNSSIFLNTSSYSGYVLYASLGATTIELKRLSNADVTIGYIAFV